MRVPCMAERSLPWELQDPDKFPGPHYSQSKMGDTPVILNGFPKKQVKSWVVNCFFKKAPLNLRDFYYVYKQL